MCNHIWNKNGKNKHGIQRHRCRVCGAVKQDTLSLLKAGRPAIYEKTSDRFLRENRKMTYSYNFDMQDSWTSHTGLSAEVYEAIKASNYNEYPRWAILPNGKKLGLRQDDWDRMPTKTTPSGYAWFPDGDGGSIRIKEEVISKSPNYDDRNGNGMIHRRLTVKAHVQLHFATE